MVTRCRAGRLFLAFVVMLTAFYSATYVDSRYLRDWAAEANGIE
jgi:hypothetical protein